MLPLYLAGFIQHTVPAVAISQIQSNDQFLLRNIPALRCRSGANLLRCRSPFICASSTSITWERIASRPETGLLIPSVFVKYQSTSVEQTEEAKPVNLGPQIAKAYGV